MVELGFDPFFVPSGVPNLLKISQKRLTSICLENNDSKQEMPLINIIFISDLTMCTIICTVRTVLWYIMSLAGTLMILISLLTQKWVDGRLSAVSLSSLGKLILSQVQNHVFLTSLPFPENVKDAAKGIFDTVTSDEIENINDMGKALEKNLGLFGILKTCMVSFLL